MKVGVENHWRLNGIKIHSMRARTEMLTSLESHQLNPVVIQLLIVIFATRTEPLKYSTVKRKHFWQFFFASPKSLRKVVLKSARNSMELTSLRREQRRALKLA